MARPIKGRYEPLRVAGKGGQGEVVHAIDRQHDRHVALKSRPVGSAADREHLLAEARILLGLRPHPGLPLVREDFFAGDRYYVAMDWIEGANLQQALTDVGGDGLPPAQVAGWISQVASALDHLHAHDPPVVHRDVKPSNMILRPDGRVVLVDFGIAGREPGDGAAAGSPGYAAPELSSAPTPRSDVYGLAATAYALLSGRPPQPGAPPTPSVDLDPLRRALATDPSKRPSSAGDFARDLAAALNAGGEKPSPGGAASDASATGVVSQAPARTWSRARIAVIAAVASGLVAAVATVALVSASGSGRPAPAGASVLPEPSAVPTDVATAIPGAVGVLRALPPAGGPPAPRRPKEGMYTLAVEGWEQITGFSGNRISLPKTATMGVAQDPTDDLAYGTAYRMDVLVRPGQHEEQMLVDFDDSSDPMFLNLLAESVSVELPTVIGPGGRWERTKTLTTGGRYRGPLWMVRYPIDETAPREWNRNHEVGDSGRTESMRARVLGWQALTIAGRTVETFVVESRSDFGGTEAGFRARRIWFSPADGVVVKWAERTHWEWKDCRAPCAYDLSAIYTVTKMPGGAQRSGGGGIRAPSPPPMPSFPSFPTFGGR